MNNKNLKSVFSAFSKSTQNGNLLICIEGLDENKKYQTLVFYASQDLKKYLVNEAHEIGRGMFLDKSEWKRSESWTAPAEKLEGGRMELALRLWDKRDLALKAKIREVSEISRKKSNEGLKSLGLPTLKRTWDPGYKIGDVWPKNQTKK